MPRAKLIRTDSSPYHITSRSNNRDWFYIPIDDVWFYANELLSAGNEKFKTQVDAFVLMNNHYHLCINTPEANIDKFMHFFNKNLGTKIARQANRINRIFGAPYKWTLVNDQNYYMNVIRYIYQNPIRSGIVTNCLDYEYSDVKKQNWNESEIAWFNSQTEKEHTNQVQKKLKRYVLNQHVEPK